jgi:UDP-N-acetylglucosamine transferase subunit ALG13
VLLAVMHGHHPIVMPRRPDLGEGVDDHQVQFARRLEREGLATVVDGPTDVDGALRALRRRDGAGAAGDPDAVNPLLRRLGQDVHDALARV